MKRLIIVLLIFSNYYLFASPIISGFGLFYKLSYDKALKQIKSDGFVISKEYSRRDTNTDRKLIDIENFEYDGIPYVKGTFSFDRDLDGEYYFTIAEGDVDTVKIDEDLDYAAKFYVFLEQCKEKYIMTTEEYPDKQLVGFKGDNDGYIILEITEKLHIAYFPKSPVK